MSGSLVGFLAEVLAGSPADTRRAVNELRIGRVSIGLERRARALSHAGAFHPWHDVQRWAGDSTAFFPVEREDRSAWQRTVGAAGRHALELAADGAVRRLRALFVEGRFLVRVHAHGHLEVRPCATGQVAGWDPALDPGPPLPVPGHPMLLCCGGAETFGEAVALASAAAKATAACPKAAASMRRTAVLNASRRGLRLEATRRDVYHGTIAVEGVPALEAAHNHLERWTVVFEKHLPATERPDSRERAELERTLVAERFDSATTAPDPEAVAAADVAVAAIAAATRPSAIAVRSAERRAAAVLREAGRRAS